MTRSQAFLRYYLPALLWAAVVSLFSTGTFHSGTTLRLIRRVLQFFWTEVSPATLLAINTLLRKASHSAEYCVFAFLVWRALRRGSRLPWRPLWAAVTLALAALLAVADELHQGTVAVRTGSWIDVGFDLLGACLFVLWQWWRARRAAHAVNEGNIQVGEKGPVA